MAKVSYVTKEGLQNLKKELAQLENVERPSIAEQIGEARDKGDLSENAEYDAAKEAQGLLEMKIAKLKNLVANSRLIDESKLDKSIVQILSTVKIKNAKTKKVMQYTLVPESEANLKEGKLSVESPIAKALIGKKKGAKVEVTAPAGKIPFEIVDINIE